MTYRPTLFLSIIALSLASLAGCENAGKEGEDKKISVGPVDTVKVSTDNFQKVVLDNESIVVVDFWATWCGPCVQLAPTMEQLAKEYKGQFTVGKVDVDQNQSLAAEYKIENIPAVLVFKGGELKERLVGVRSIEEYRSTIDALASETAAPVKTEGPQSDAPKAE